MMRVLEYRFRLRACPPSAPLCGRELRQYPMPDVEVTWNRRAGRITNRELRNLYEAGFDGVNQSKVAHHPGEWAIRRLADSTEIVRRRRKINAEVYPSKLIDSVETVYPNRRLLEEVFSLIFFA